MTEPWAPQFKAAGPGRWFVLNIRWPDGDCGSVRRVGGGTWRIERDPAEQPWPTRAAAALAERDLARHDAGREVFTLLAYQWDVTRAHELAAGKPVLRAAVAGLAGMLPFIAVDPARAQTRDLSEPLLVVTHPAAGRIVIDGWHRLRKALTEGCETLPARLLDETEEQQVRLCGGS